MQKNRCADCMYFSRHYAFDGRKIFRVNCGHCTLHQQKSKLPHAAPCTHFVPGTSPENAFVSKEYLSKELLQYILHLDLLPEIEEFE